MNTLTVTKRATNLKKEVLVDRVEAITGAVRDGKLNPLDAFLTARAYAEVSKLIMDDIKELAIDEARKYKKDEAVKFGVTFEVTSGSDFYNYEADPVVAELTEKIKNRKKILKNAIQSSKSGLLTADENGEAVDPPPLKYQTGESIRVKF